MPTSSRGMMSAVSDPFERFAAECELSVSVEAISVAPREFVASPADADEYFLVTLTGPRAEAGPIHLVIVIPPTDKRAAPTARDALWWLAANRGRSSVGAGIWSPGRLYTNTPRRARPRYGCSSGNSDKRQACGLCSAVNTSDCWACTRARFQRRGKVEGKERRPCCSGQSEDGIE
jgi:hypothetical protein